MKSTPVKIFVNQSLGASASSAGLYLDQVFGLSFVATWTGVSAAGTIKVQVSNDQVSPAGYSYMNAAGLYDPAQNVVNWYDYAGTVQTIAGAGSFFWNMSTPGYIWAKLLFTYSSGTGTINANACIKGWK